MSGYGQKPEALAFLGTEWEKIVGDPKYAVSSNFKPFNIFSMRFVKSDGSTHTDDFTGVPHFDDSILLNLSAIAQYNPYGALNFAWSHDGMGAKFFHIDLNMEDACEQNFPVGPENDDGLPEYLTLQRFFAGTKNYFYSNGIKFSDRSSMWKDTVGPDNGTDKGALADTLTIPLYGPEKSGLTAAMMITYDRAFLVDPTQEAARGGAVSYAGGMHDAATIVPGYAAKVEELRAKPEEERLKDFLDATEGSEGYNMLRDVISFTFIVHSDNKDTVPLTLPHLAGQDASALVLSDAVMRHFGNESPVAPQASDFFTRTLFNLLNKVVEVEETNPYNRFYLLRPGYLALSAGEEFEAFYGQLEGG